jgi:hypothetical protein
MAVKRSLTDEEMRQWRLDREELGVFASACIFNENNGTKKARRQTIADRVWRAVVLREIRHEQGR